MKKDKDFNFRFVGSFNQVESLVDDVRSIDPETWNYFKGRQQTIVGHRYTKTIPLIFDWQKKTRLITHKLYDSFKIHLDSISSFLQEAHEDYEIVRANLVLLSAGKSIDRHMDKGDFLLSSRRIHIPVLTNTACIFIIDDEQKHLSVGEVWEVNNTGKFHSVHNEGGTDRVHLIIDVK